MENVAQHKPTILVVDDDPNNIEVFLETLKQKDYKILVALDGESAIQRAKIAQPDLIILDIMMPGIDGFETCDRLKKHEKTYDIPVIFMTALTDTEDKIKGLELGAVDFISKPFSTTEVLMRIKIHLQLRRQQKELMEKNRVLAESHAILNSVVNSPKDVLIFALDTDLKLIEFNKSFQQKVKKYWEIDLQKGMNLLDIISSEQERNGFKTISAKVLSGQSFRTIQTNKFNETFEFNYNPIIDDEGNVIGISSYQTDITEQERTRKELEEKEETFRKLTDQVSLGVCILSPDGKPTFINQAAEKMFGIEKEEDFCDKDFHFVFAPESYHEAYQAGWEKFKLTGGGPIVEQVREVMARRTDGTEFPIELSVGVIKKDDGWHSIGIIKDITQQIQLEEKNQKYLEELEVNKDLVEQNANELVMLNAKLQESEEELMKLNATKDKFFSIIAHDLKNPFSGILGLSGMIVEDYEELTEDEIKMSVSQVLSAAKQAYNLLENLLQWSRSQKGAIILDFEDYLLYPLIEENISLLQSQADRKEITISAMVPDTLAAFMDYNTINTVVRNLISNALKFTNKGGRVTISAQDSSEDKMVEIHITDTGVGMTPEDTDKLFRIDVHHSTQGTDNEKGTGLGLILCKEFVEKNSGQIKVESEVGKGSTFKILLPESISSIDD